MPVTCEAVQAPSAQLALPGRSNAQLGTLSRGRWSRWHCECVQVRALAAFEPWGWRGEKVSHLPRAHHDRHVLTSTVYVFGAAHWLLAESAPQPGGDALPFDALVVFVHPGGNVELTELSAVRARWPHLDRLLDGGFVVAASRARRYEDGNQVQLFDGLGHETSSFSVGDTAEHLLVDEAGLIWGGHFDENPSGIRRLSTTGRPKLTSSTRGPAGQRFQGPSTTEPLAA